MGVLDTNFVWFVDNNKFYKLIGGLDNPWVVYTIDTGLYCYFAAFKDVDNGLATDAWVVYKTTNGGVNWVLHNNEVGVGASDFVNVKNTNWIIVSGMLGLRISYDFCNTWQPKVEFPLADSVWNMYLDAYDTTSIWVAAGKGRLLKYNFNYIGISENNNRVPKEFVLYQNYPNPFNPATVISYDLPFEGEVVFKIFDVLGREVYSSTEFKKAGAHEITFDGSALSSGLYYYRVESGEYSEAKKMLLLK